MDGTPAASSDAVRERMRRQRSRDTAPEMALRAALRAAGVGYRLGRRVHGARPDAVLVGARVAVFVDGAFWHGCPIHSRPPSGENAAWWREKVRRNRERDARQDAALVDAGWAVVRVCERDDPADAARHVRALRDMARVRVRLVGVVRIGAHRAAA